MVGDAIYAGSVIIYETEIIACARTLFRALTELVETGRNGTRLARTVAVGWDGRFGDGVDEGAIGGKKGGGVDTKYRGVAGSVDFGFDGAALDLVFYSVEEEGGAEEVEEGS